MEIYFAGSIRAGRDDAELYARIIQKLQAYGTVLTEHVGSKHTTEEGGVQEDRGLTDKEIHDRDMDWMEKAEVVVAEVTQPSLGVGYEIGRALEMGKRILCLFRPSSGKRLSAMIAGAENGDKFVCKTYKEVELDAILKDFLAKDAE